MKMENVAFCAPTSLCYWIIPGRESTTNFTLLLPGRASTSSFPREHSQYPGIDFMLLLRIPRRVSPLPLHAFSKRPRLCCVNFMLLLKSSKQHKSFQTLSKLQNAVVVNVRYILFDVFTFETLVKQKSLDLKLTQTDFLLSWTHSAFSVKIQLQS